MAGKYQMQAIVDGLLRSYLLDAPNWSGAAYPGPGTPSDVWLYSSPTARPAVSALLQAIVSSPRAAMLGSIGIRPGITAALAALVSSPTAAFAGNVKYFGPVAGRAVAPTQLLAAGSYNYQHPVKVLVGAGFSLPSIKIAFNNWSGTSETSTGGTLTANAQLEYPAGTFTRITFGGLALGSESAGGNLWSDDTPLAVPVPHGASAILHCRVANPVGVPYQGNWFGDVASGDKLVNSASDLTGTTLTDTLGGGMFPAAICGLTALPTYGIIGDSIAAGASDNSADAAGHRGVIARPLGLLDRAYVNTAIPGDQAVSFLTHGAKRRALLAAAGVNSIICEYSTNDLFVGSRSAAQLQSDLNTIRSFIEFAALAFYQTTCLPRSGSTNGFIDTANQFTLAQEPQRIAFDTNLRSGGFTAATGVIETCTPFETSLNSGIVKAPGFTTDGTHMNTAAYKLLSFSVP